METKPKLARQMYTQLYRLAFPEKIQAWKDATVEHRRDYQRRYRRKYRAEKRDRWFNEKGFTATGKFRIQ